MAIVDVLKSIDNFMKKNPTPAVFANQQFQKRVAQPIAQTVKSTYNAGLNYPIGKTSFAQALPKLGPAAQKYWMEGQNPFPQQLQPLVKAPGTFITGYNRAFSAPFTNKPLLEKIGDIAAAKGQTIAPFSAMLGGGLGSAMGAVGNVVGGKPLTQNLAKNYQEGFDYGAKFATIEKLIGVPLKPLLNKLSPPQMANVNFYFNAWKNAPDTLKKQAALLMLKRVFGKISAGVISGGVGMGGVAAFQPAKTEAERLENIKKGAGTGALFGGGVAAAGMGAQLLGGQVIKPGWAKLKELNKQKGGFIDPNAKVGDELITPEYAKRMTPDELQAMKMKLAGATDEEIQKTTNFDAWAKTMRRVEGQGYVPDFENALKANDPIQAKQAMQEMLDLGDKQYYKTSEKFYQKTFGEPSGLKFVDNKELAKLRQAGYPQAAQPPLYDVKSSNPELVKEIKGMTDKLSKTKLFTDKTAFDRAFEARGDAPENILSYSARSQLKDLGFALQEDPKLITILDDLPDSHKQVVLDYLKSNFNIQSLSPPLSQSTGVGVNLESGFMDLNAKIGGEKPLKDVTNMADFNRINTEFTVGDSIDKVTKALTEAAPIRKEQEALYSAARSQKIAKAIAMGEKVPGEQGYFAQLGSLKGQLPKAQFEGIRNQIGQDDVDNLFKAIETSQGLSPFEKINTKTGLAKLLGAEGGSVPTEGELNLLNQVFPKEFTQAVLDKRPLMQKLFEGTENALNLPRAMMATGDFSAPLRQGIFLIGRPKQWIPAFRDMFKYAFSEDAYKGLQDDIQSRPTYDLMRENRLGLTDMGGLSTREESFMSNLSEKIPGFGKLAAGSNRAYSGFLNKLRADTFDDLYNTAQEQGLIKDNPKIVADIANFVNAATGRGKLPDLIQKAAPTLNAAFFSPRLMASRLSLLNPLFYVKLDPFVRKEALKSLLTFAGTGITIASLAKLGGADVGTDPRSADFGKIKINNTRYDPWGGFQQYIVAASRLLTGQMVSSTTGKQMTLGEGYKATTAYDILQRFFESKESPIASFITSLLKGQTNVGEKISLPVEIIDRFIPMVWSDAYELSRAWGPAKGLIMAMPGLFGVGSQTYGDQIPMLTKSATTGAPKLEWRQSPGLGEALLNKITGKQVSNIPVEQQAPLVAQKEAETLRKIALDKVRAEVLATGRPQTYDGTYVYLKNGIVTTKSLEEKAPRIDLNTLNVTSPLPQTSASYVVSSDAPKNVIDKVILYSRGVLTDPENTIKAMFTDEVLRKISGDAAILERKEYFNTSGDPNLIADHIIPLGLGGDNADSNKMYQSKEASEEKDILEKQLIQQLQDGKISKREAQAKIKEWVASHPAPIPLITASQTYAVNDKNVEGIDQDWIPPVLELTQYTELNKQLVSAYNSALTKRITQIKALRESGEYTDAQAEAELQRVADLKALAKNKSGSLKTKKLAKLAVQKVNKGVKLAQIKTKRNTVKLLTAKDIGQKIPKTAKPTIAMLKVKPVETQYGKLATNIKLPTGMKVS